MSIKKIKKKKCANKNKIKRCDNEKIMKCNSNQSKSKRRKLNYWSYRFNL